MRLVWVGVAVSLSFWSLVHSGVAQADASPDAQSLLGATILDCPQQPRGALLNLIVPGGAAYRSGLSSGDVVTAIDRKPIQDADTLARALAAHVAGDRVELTVAHLGATPRPFVVVLRAPDAASGGKSPSPLATAEEQEPAAWALFTDPIEHAFSIEVPAGWRVHGGVRRSSKGEVHPAVEAVSPDRAITVFFGDNSIPAFIVPDRMLATAGFAEGSLYSPGSGPPLTVARYLDGAGFAASWGARRIAQSCPDPKRQVARSLPEASRGFDRAYAAEAIRSSIRAGEASFVCSMASQDAVGYVFAATELGPTGSNATWQVKLVSGYIAPAEQSVRAARLLSHVSASFQVDSGWISQYNQAAATVGRAVQASAKAMSEAVAERWRSELRASKSTADRYSTASAAQDRNPGAAR